MDCVTPQLSGSSGAVATFVSQRTLKITSNFIYFKNAVGAFFAGLPFSYLIKKFGWTMAFLILELVGALYVLFISYLFIKHYNSYITITSRKQK